MKLKPTAQPKGVILEKIGEPREHNGWTIQQYKKVDSSEFETIYEHGTHQDGRHKWFKLVDEDED